jgi:large subunit ribosomal protein L17
MRHRVAGKELSRTSAHRKALRRNLAASLIEHGAIRTTQCKAKELRRFVEKLITTAKAGTVHARRRVLAKLRDRKMFDDEGEMLEQTVVQKLFSEIAPRYANRPGGYTRIVRISDRRIGDAGRQVIMQLVEESAAEKKETEKRSSRRKRRAARRKESAGQAQAAANTEGDKAGSDEQAGSDEKRGET